LFSVRLLLLLFLAACDSGDAKNDGCHRDADCPSGSCIASVCVMLTNPLDAAIPDLTSND
jgi:hypothetical protein